MIIDTFHADYVISKANADPFTLKKRFDTIAADLLGRELETLPARMLPDPSVLVFIKKLSVHLVLNPAKIDDRAAAGLWARRIAAAVAEIARTVTAFPGVGEAVGKETGSNVALFRSQAVYLAHFIHDLLGVPGAPGEVLNRWYYSQFREFSSFSPVQIVKLLCKQNRQILPGIFTFLEQMGRTERILGEMTDEDARFLYSLLPGESVEPGKPVVETDINRDEEVLRFINDILRGGRISPEFIYSNVGGYKLCLKIYMLYLVFQKKYPVPGPFEAVKGVIREIVMERPGSISILRDVEGKKTGKEPRKVKTAYGGLFLLIPVVREMVLSEMVRVSSLPDGDNLSALNAILFFTASAVVRGNRDAESHPYIDAADPGFFIFAGLEPDASFQLLQDYPKIVPPSICKEFLSSLTKVFGSAETFFQKGFCPPEALNFDTIISILSQIILRLFARRLKGFEGSGGAYLFKHFLLRTSEIRWDRRGVRVTLSPKPLDTVLRMSGLLDEIGGVEWLENRNVIFRLGGE